MLIFISLFTHQGNQEWGGVGEEDQGNTFFLRLIGEVEAGPACVRKVLRHGR